MQGSRRGTGPQVKDGLRLTVIKGGLRGQNAGWTKAALRQESCLAAHIEQVNKNVIRRRLDLEGDTETDVDALADLFKATSRTGDPAAMHKVMTNLTPWLPKFLLHTY